MDEVCTNFRGRIPGGGGVVEGIISSDLKYHDFLGFLHAYLPHAR